MFLRNLRPSHWDMKPITVKLCTFYFMSNLILNKISHLAPNSSIPRYGSSFLLEVVQSFQQEEKAAGSPRDELKPYLKSGHCDLGIASTDSEDVIAW